MMPQNLWDAAKAVLRGKFIAIQSYIKEQETSQINNLILHLKQLEKEQKKPQGSRRKEIIKMQSTRRVYNKYSEIIIFFLISRPIIITSAS